MKFSVAFLLVPLIFTSGIVWGQTPPRRSGQSADKPRNDTLRICQGVAIPDGYVIIAYMTSSACPHGAYLLKKQSNYESSLAVNAGASTGAGQPATPSSATTTKPTKSNPQTGTQSARGSGTQARKTTGSQTSPVQKTGSTASAASRPRRVGSTAPTMTQAQNSSERQTGTQTGSQMGTQSQDTASTPQGPPVLIGSQPVRPLGPPTLGNMGPKSAASPADQSSDAAAQTGPEEVGEGDVLRVSTSLVAVPVSVLDRQGRFVPNLKREDFKVFENGVEQEVAYFEPAEKPFTVALVLDTSASTQFHLQDIRAAALGFAKQLRPQDRVLIVSFSDEVLLLTEVTNDMNLIETVIADGVNAGNSTRLYDAVNLTIGERLNKIKGRKAMVLFTDGVDTSSQQATYESTMREVDELDALIYPIKYDTSDYMRAMQGAGNGAVTVTTTTRGIFGTSTSTQTYNVPVNNGLAIPGTTKADYDRANRYLHALADKTGGRLYEANDTTQLSQAFTRIAEELRRQYSLGYYPKTENAETTDGRRQIRVKVRQPNLAVKARDSYVKSPATPNK